jgi:glycosyltransferase involved in cell wall biosynthesis
MIRVGLILPIWAEWQGGVNYFHNLLSSYGQNPDPALTIVVFAQKPEDFTSYCGRAIEIHPWEGMPQRSFWNVPRRVFKRAFAVDRTLIRLLRTQRIDLLSHLSPVTLCTLGNRMTFPSLPWMADFQHKRIPEFFSEGESASRDSFVASSGRWGNILLSSHAATADFRRYYPELSSVRTHVLHFSGARALLTAPLSRDELAAQYPVGEPYFYLPNQFWKHKNHAVVVEAMRFAQPEFRVICTGSGADARDPAYFAELMKRIEELDLKDRFLYLGSVPYPIVISLMHHSLAVLQPSLFEGWSTSVEEAKAMRKVIVLSDIDVHHEQAPERGIYFSPRSPEELSERLRCVFNDFDPQSEEMFARQRFIHNERLNREWVEDYVRIVRSIARL